MKSPLIAVLAAVTVCAIACLTMLMRSGSSEPGAAVGPRPVAGPDGDLLARVAALGEENRELRDRLAMLEARPTQRAAADGFVSKLEFEAFRDELRKALASRNGPFEGVATESAQFKQQIAGALSEIRHEEAVAKLRSKNEQRLARLDESMPKFEAWLELSPSQSDSMRSALLAQYEREAEIVRLWEAGENDEVLGEMKTSNREAHVTELSGFLSREQLGTYTSRGGVGK